jgi:hypothetical protein
MNFWKVQINPEAKPEKGHSHQITKNDHVTVRYEHSKNITNFKCAKYITVFQLQYHTSSGSRV